MGVIKIEHLWTHELADERIRNEIKERSKSDFIALCNLNLTSF